MDRAVACGTRGVGFDPSFVSLVPKEVGWNQTFFNWAIPGLFFFIFVFSGLQLTDNYIQRCHCRCWDLNHGTLVSEANCATTSARMKPDTKNLRDQTL